MNATDEEIVNDPQVEEHDPDFLRYLNLDYINEIEIDKGLTVATEKVNKPTPSSKGCSFPSFLNDVILVPRRIRTEMSM